MKRFLQGMISDKRYVCTIETCEWRIVFFAKKSEVWFLLLLYFKGLDSTEQEAAAFKRNTKERIIHE